MKSEHNFKACRIDFKANERESPEDWLRMSVATVGFIRDHGEEYAPRSPSRPWRKYLFRLFSPRWTKSSHERLVRRCVESSDDDRLLYCEGIALGMGVWVHHIWAVDSNGRAVEVLMNHTQDRYFGACLSPETVDELLTKAVPYDKWLVAVADGTVPGP